MNYEEIEEEALCPRTRFHAAANSGRNVFLTGMAGTGKSHLLREWISVQESILGWDHAQKIALTAPTGIAALNIGGTTIHRWAGIGIGPQDGQSFEGFYESCQIKQSAKHEESVQAAKIVVIDEISMLNGTTLAYLNYALKRLRSCTKPFGGLQVIAIGDFLQLPPVKTEEGENYDWCFMNPAWDELEFVNILLTENRRQSDPNFIRTLAGARCGELRGASAKLLQERIVRFPPSSVPRLFTHNSMVDNWNRVMIADLPGEPTTIQAYVPPHGRVILNSMLTPEELTLKKGAMVMFTANSYTSGQKFFNGQIGYVDSIAVGETHLDQCDRGKDGYIWVRSGDDRIPVTPRMFGFSGSGSGVRQFPLRPAYAMTIHKAQGLTLPTAYMDIRAAREPGQAYVALSRVQSLKGLMLKDWPKGLFVSLEARKFYEERNLWQ